MPDPDRFSHSSELRESEIHLDLAGPPPDSGPGLDPAPRRRRIPNAYLGLAAAVLTLAAAVTTAWSWLPGQDPIAERTIRAYLEAVREGDVEDALSMTNLEDDDDEVLTPATLEDSWEINEVAQVEYRENRGGFDATADVYVEIEAYDGTRLGDRLTVGIDEGAATILSGFGEIDFSQSVVVGVIEINGVTTELEGEDTVRLRFLPGVYEFYGSAPDTFEFETPERLVLGNSSIALGGQEAAGLEVPWPQVSDTGQELLNERLREHFDDCAADPAAELCPFAPPSGAENVEIGPDAEWTVTAYPEGSVEIWESVGDALVVSTVRPGSVEVEATITGSGGETREATLSCPLLVDGMTAVFPYEGGVELRSGPTVVAQECPSMVEAE